MIVLDAYAVIALLSGEPARDEIADLLRTGNAHLSVLNLAEVIDRLGRKGMPVDMVSSSINNLVEGGLRVVHVDREMAELAAHLRVKHYHRQSCSLSMADCMALATTIWGKGALATADPALIATSKSEGVPVVNLPDSQGQRVE